MLSEAHDGMRDSPAEISGADKEARAINLAIENARLAGLEEAVRFECGDVLDDKLKVSIAHGLVLTNPPYGERLETDVTFYQQLGSALSASYGGWHCGLFTANAAPLRQTRLPIKSTLAVNNGSIECALYEGVIPSVSAKASSANRRASAQSAPMAATKHVEPSVWSEAVEKRSSRQDTTVTVSYTHLTLPTILLV